MLPVSSENLNRGTPLSYLDRGIRATAMPSFPHDPGDERAWHSGPAYMTASGLTVDFATALRVSCIFQGVRLIGQTIGSMPIRVQQDLGGGKRKEVDDAIRPGIPSPGAAVRRLLKKRPNSWQTPKQFRETLTAWSILWGMGLAEIKPGDFGAFDELWPIQPEWVQPEQIKGTRRLRFVINEPGEPTRTLTQDEVFRVDGFGLTGNIGDSVLKLAREAIGLWVSHEKFQGLFFSQGAKPSVWLQHPAKLASDAYLRLKTQSEERYGGWSNHHKVAIVEEGIVVKETGWNLQQSQSSETKRDLVEEMARYLNLSPQFFMLTAEPTHSSAEVFNQNAIDFTFLPVAVAWEQSAERDLLLEEEGNIVVKHVFDSLLRGKTLERAQAYAQFIMNGVMSENECRILEDLDPREGLDEPRRSANQDRGADPNQGTPPTAPPPPPRKKKKKPADDPAAARHLQLAQRMAESAAERVVRRELEAIRTKGAKLAGDPVGWAAWVDEFYAAHGAVVAEALQLPPLLARKYVEGHRVPLKEGGLSAAASWDIDAVEQLTALALAA